MSFLSKFEQYNSEMQACVEAFSRRTEEHPLQMEREIETNEKKLELFLENFQNEIIALRKSEERDCKMIQNLKHENEQRKNQSKLIEKATKMEEGVVARLRASISLFEQLSKDYDMCALKHNENLNRNELDLDHQEQTLWRKANNNANPIEIDKENSKLIIKIDKGAIKLFEIFYSKRDDRFVPPNSLSIDNERDKFIIQTIKEFNFHRDMGKLYNDLYNFS